MPIPKKIKVGYLTYDVIDDNRMLLAADASALHVGNDGQIFVDAKAHPDVVRHHLVHEVLHACLHVGAFDSEKTPEGEEGEEFVVTGVAPHLLLVLRENPKLLAYLLERG